MVPSSTQIMVHLMVIQAPSINNGAYSWMISQREVQRVFLLGRLKRWRADAMRVPAAGHYSAGSVGTLLSNQVW